MTHTGFAPGKLILMGEHAVVYGHPAIAMAVDRGTHVTLTDRHGATGLDVPWIDDPRLTAALHAVLPAAGVGVKIQSDLPIGRGMGSSGALAVALARAALARSGAEQTDVAVGGLALSVERIFHGNPSGIDHTVSMRAGALQYHRSPTGPVFSPIDLAPLPIVVIDSNTAGDTAKQVASVAALGPSAEGYLAQIGTLVQATIPALAEGDIDVIGQAWHENHWLLRAIGVSTPTLDAIVRAANEAGATGAKLAGAGGGGVVIALAHDPAKLIKSMNQRGWKAFTVAKHRTKFREITAR